MPFLALLEVVAYLRNDLVERFFISCQLIVRHLFPRHMDDDMSIVSGIGGSKGRA